MSLKLGYRTRSSGMSMRSAPARAISISSSDVAPIHSPERPYYSSGLRMQGSRFRIPLVLASILAVVGSAPSASLAPAAPLARLAPPAPEYSRFFTSDTLRLDYVHGGGPGGEAFTFERI